MQAYCMKCRAKREMKDAKAITMKNDKPATQGVCPVCGTKMFRIGKSQNWYFSYQHSVLGLDICMSVYPSLFVVNHPQRPIVQHIAGDKNLGPFEGELTGLLYYLQRRERKVYYL